MLKMSRFLDMNAKPSVSFFLIVVCAFASACEKKQMGGPIKREHLESTTMRDVLSGDVFTATVIERNVDTLPDPQKGIYVNVVIIRVTREDDVGLAIIAQPANAAEIEAANRLEVGKTYRFPDVLR